MPPHNFASKIFKQGSGGFDESAVCCVEIIVCHYVVIKFFGKDHLRDQMVKALSYLPAGNTVVDNIDYGLLRIFQVMKDYFAIVANGLSNNMCKRNILSQNGFDHELSALSGAGSNAFLLSLSAL